MNDRDTLRKWLMESGFSPRTGVIVYHEVRGFDPGWDNGPDDVMARREIPWDDPILDYEFDSGFGGPSCPRIFARDGYRIFFPSQYDGATSLVTVNVDPSHYLKNGSVTPYPGG